jgi:hypothetical protein
MSTTATTATPTGCQQSVVHSVEPTSAHRHESADDGADRPDDDGHDQEILVCPA